MSQDRVSTGYPPCLRQAKNWLFRRKDFLSLVKYPARTGPANENEDVGDWVESDLAWELADAISPLLGERNRVQLYGALGAGGSYAAIDTLLQTMALERLAIPSEFIPKLTRWLDAYAQSDDAPRLRELLHAVKALR